MQRNYTYRTKVSKISKSYADNTIGNIKSSDISAELHTKPKLNLVIPRISIIEKDCYQNYKSNNKKSRHGIFSSYATCKSTTKKFKLNTTQELNQKDHKEKLPLSKKTTTSINNINKKKHHVERRFICNKNTNKSLSRFLSSNCQHKDDLEDKRMKEKLKEISLNESTFELKNNIDTSCRIIPKKNMNSFLKDRIAQLTKIKNQMAENVPVESLA